MQIVPTQKRLAADQQRLLELFERLDHQQRQSLLSFAAFLTSQVSAESEPEDELVHQPKRIDRPREESVVKAIKRLSETYFMVEKELLLDETSSLMMAHMMQGRDAQSVIDELEALFARHYQNYLDDRTDGGAE
ncbi:MAG: Crp/Fnr family transcriptional regulator [Candidatus Thiodiazotropha sp.]